MTNQTFRTSIEPTVLEKGFLSKQALLEIVELYFTGYMTTADEYIPIYSHDEGYLILTKKETVKERIHIIVYDILETSSVRMKHGVIIL